MFNHIHIEIPQATLLETKEGHYYKTPQGDTYESITTFLGKRKDQTSLNEWKERMGYEVARHISREAMKNGTETHKRIEEYLYNRQSIMNNLVASAHFVQLKPFLDKINNIHFLEVPLYSDKLKLAGTCDCIAEYDGKLSIIDFKTTTKKKKDEYKKDYELQVTAYSMMYEELSGIKIDKGIVLISGLDESSECYPVKIDEHREKLMEIIG